MSRLPVGPATALGTEKESLRSKPDNKKFRHRSIPVAGRLFRVEAAKAQENSDAPAIIEAQIERYRTSLCLIFCPATAFMFENVLFDTIPPLTWPTSTWEMRGD
jgi:hypothetical protein